MKTEQLPAEVREVADRLNVALGDDLGALLWHGSYARGEAKADSDHDLIIVLKRIDDGVLLRMREVFQGRANWSTLVLTEQELRQYPVAGRLQFTYGAKLLYGDFDPPEMTRERVIDEIRGLARDIRFECRYRLLHKEQARAPADERMAVFQQGRNWRMLGYAAKWAVLALKARELLAGRPYPLTRDELRARLGDPKEIAIVDLVENWPPPGGPYPRELAEVALRLDACARGLVAWLEAEAAA